MRYEGRIYRPPSEAYSYLLQATIGCTWNHCTYCSMYSDKPKYRLRDLEQTLEDIEMARVEIGSRVDKVFITDGDPLAMPMEHWRPILGALRRTFPRLKRVSTYATAMNLLDKTPEQLAELRQLGLSLLYIGPESGDPATLKSIAKGADFDEHVECARRAREAGMSISAIFLLGCGGAERSEQHARGSAALATAMDPAFLAALTLTVVPGTPIHKLQQRGRFKLPEPLGMLRELRIFVGEAAPTDALFRTNHASNYLPLKGRLPADRDSMLQALDAALDGRIGLRPEWLRGL